MPFDYLAARAARQKNKKLTVFDTGERLQPIPWREDDNAMRCGPVDFENDESNSILTVEAFPSALVDDTIVMTLERLTDHRLEIMSGGTLLFVIEEDGTVSLP